VHLLLAWLALSPPARRPDGPGLSDRRRVVYLVLWSYGVIVDPRSGAKFGPVEHCGQLAALAW